MAEMIDTSAQGASAQGRPAVPGRLLWRCRRGMKELDVMLERFARRAACGVGPGDLPALERLLSLPDPQLAGYLLGEEVPEDAGLRAIAARIRDLCHGSPVC